MQEAKTHTARDLSHPEKVILLEEAHSLDLTSVKERFLGKNKKEIEETLKAEAAIKKDDDNDGEMWEVHFYNYGRTFSTTYPDIVMLPNLCFYEEEICEKVFYMPDINL